MTDKKLADLIDKLIRQPESSFADIDKLLRLFGYKDKSKGSSHHRYRRKGDPPIQIVTKSGRRVSKNYIKKAIDILIEQGLLQPLQEDKR